MTPQKTPSVIGAEDKISGFTLVKNNDLQGMIFEKKSEDRF